MTKSDLKTGMRVKLRNGFICIVVCNCETAFYGLQDFCLFGDNFFFISHKFNSDLSNVDREYDIVAVYRHLGDSDFLNLNSLGDLLWKRTETKKHTVKEISELLGYTVEIVE